MSRADKNTLLEQSKVKAQEAGDYIAQKGKDIKEGAINAKDTSVEKLNETGAYIKDKADKMGDYLAEKGKDVKEGAINAKNATAEKLSELGTKTNEGAHDTGVYIKEKAVNAWEVTKEKKNDAVKYIKEAGIPGKVASGLDSAWTGIKTTRQKVGDYVNGTPDDVVKAKETVADYEAKNK